MIFETLLAALLQTTTPTFIVPSNTPLKVQFEQLAAADNIYKWGCVSANPAIPNPATVTLTVVAGPVIPVSGKTPYTADIPAFSTGVYGCAVSVSNDFMRTNKLPDTNSDPVAVITGQVAGKPVIVTVVVR
jgi:hypothetical protein